MQLQTKQYRSTRTNFHLHPLENKGLIKNDIIGATNHITKKTPSVDDILEKTCWIRSEKGILETTKLVEKEIYTNTDTDTDTDTDTNTDTDTDINTDTDTMTDGITTVLKENDNNNTNILEIDILGNNKSDIELDIVSKILTNIEQLIKKVQDGDEPLEVISDILIEIATLWFFFLVLLMLILGVLNIINNLLRKAKINYIFKIKSAINYTILEKVLANINYKAVILKTKTIADTLLDISNKFRQLKEFYDFIKFLKNRYKQVNLKSNKIAYFDKNIVVNMMHAGNNMINQHYTYPAISIWPANSVTTDSYQHITYIWREIIAGQTKYQDTHRYYDHLTDFLHRHSNPRTEQDQKDRTYTMDLAKLTRDSKVRLNNYLQHANLEVNDISYLSPFDIERHTKEIKLISESKDYRVNESEIMSYVSKILIHYFNDTRRLREFWDIKQQFTETIGKKIPDFWIQARWQEEVYRKIIFELKT